MYALRLGFSMSKLNASTFVAEGYIDYFLLFSERSFSRQLAKSPQPVHWTEKLLLCTI